MFFNNDYSLSTFEGDLIHTIDYVMNEVQKKVLTLQDIIQFEERNHGEKTILLSCQNNRLRLLRHLASAMLVKLAYCKDFDASNDRHNVIMMRLAIASFGYGACSECSDLTIFKLNKCKINRPIHLIGVASSSNKADNHAFVIIGNCEALPIQKFHHPDDLLGVFQALPKDCIIVDPFFKVAGTPDSLPQQLIDVCRNEPFDTIICNDKTNLQQDELRKIQHQTMILIQLMSKKIHDPTEPLDTMSVIERDELRQLRVYLELMKNYKTFTYQSAKEKVRAIAQELNSAPENKAKKVASSDIGRSQISFHRKWLKSNEEKINSLSMMLNTSITP